METEVPFVPEIIALTEKKVDMALDDIIKLSKRKTNVTKGKKQRRGKNKNQKFNGAARDNTTKVRHHMNSLSAIRQGAVAKRRSNVQGNQFPVTTNIARKAAPATAPPLSVRGGAFNGGRMTIANQSRSPLLGTLRRVRLPRIAPPVQNRSLHARSNAKRHEVDEKVENRGGKRKTLDSRFASMIKQRETINNYGGVTVQVPRLPPWARARRFSH